MVKMRKNWKDITKDFLNDKSTDLAYVMKILNTIPNLIPKKDPKKIKKENTKKRKELFLEAQKNLNKDNLKTAECIHNLISFTIDQIIEEGEYSSFVWPTIITYNQAKNFYFFGEKMPEDREELWKLFYLIISSIAYGPFRINIDNISEEGRKKWRNFFINERIITRAKLSVNTNILKEKLEIKTKRMDKFYFSLLLISFWLYKIRESLIPIKSSNLLLEFLNKFSIEWGWRDNTALVIFEREGGGKASFYYFPRFSRFILKWYENFFENPKEEKVPAIVKFLDEIVMIDPKLRENSYKLREKLLFYLFRNNIVNGELLAKLVESKTNYELKRKGRIYNAQQFFSKL